ncbi:MAG: hypothetical protein WKF30_07025 [Pyrinomonadaceae bacterium]
MRDRLIGRALSESYRGVLPQGAFPVALIFLDVPRADVDVNVHPAKTEVRFLRAAAVSDAVRESITAALRGSWQQQPEMSQSGEANRSEGVFRERTSAGGDQPQSVIAFGYEPPTDDSWRTAYENDGAARVFTPNSSAAEHEFIASPENPELAAHEQHQFRPDEGELSHPHPREQSETPAAVASNAFPPLVSALGLVREIEVAFLSTNIRPLGQLEESYIIATDEEGLLLIDQHIAHERILYEKYRASEPQRAAEAQHLLMPETFDLTPAQAATFDAVSEELESYGFALMRLSGRTVAVKAVPADLPPDEARNLLAEVLDSAEAETRGAARAVLRDKIAASLACRAAVKGNTPLSIDKMRWLIDKLLATSLGATTLHGRRSFCGSPRAT